MIVSLGQATYKKRTNSIIRILLKYTDIPRVIAEEITVMTQQMEIYLMLEDQHTTNVLGHYLSISNVEAFQIYIDNLKKNIGPDLHHFSIENYIWGPYHSAETFVRTITIGQPKAYQNYLLNLDIVKNKFFSYNVDGTITGFLEVAKRVRKKIVEQSTYQRIIRKKVDFYQQRLIEAVLMYETTRKI